MDLIHVVLGLVILLFAGDILVRGAVNLSLRLGIPALIVSLTVVAIGTSAPEMLVGIDAVRKGVPGLAVGNVVGSNISNILLVLGVPALIFGLGTANSKPFREFGQMVVATLLFIVFAMMNPITWVHGLILMAVFLLILGQSVYTARRERSAAQAAPSEAIDIEGADPHTPWWKIVGFLIIGLIGLPIGANLLVSGATNIARDFHVSETVIGLTLVAVGTSLPELATTITAAFRRETDVALGNVLGSNIANLLAIIGISSFFGEIPVSKGVLYVDMWVMAASVVLLAPFIFFKLNLSRIWGGAFTGLYVVYVFFVLFRGGGA